MPLAQREVALLLILTAIAALLFSTTRVLADWSRRQKSREAAMWYDRGESLLAAGQADRAVAALRHAVSSDRANFSHALALARALGASRHDDEARQLLEQLREEDPDEPEINCRLGRFAVARNDLASAVRYYHDAMYGAETGDPQFGRRAIALELSGVLLDHHDRDGALAELIALARDLPPDAAQSERQIARLFLKAGDPVRALTHFLAAAAHPPAEDALAGAATAEIHLRNFPAALRYGQTALRDGPNREADAAVQFAKLVLTTDPLAPGIGATARDRRLAAGLDYAVSRRAACAPAADGPDSIGGELDRFRHSHPNPRDLDVLRRGVGLIARVSAALTSCGQAGDLGRAWVAIAASHGGARP